jgi:hypothetical protein
MQSTQAHTAAFGLPVIKFPKHSRKQKRTSNRIPDRKHAIEEIGAYITIRDGLLAEAEKSATSELLRRLSTANDFVETCLKPARGPYEAQFLPEIDASRERQRCQAVKTRIAQIGDRR